MKALAETKAAPLPPLSAIGSAIIQLYGPTIMGNGVWDQSRWDEAQWYGPKYGWRDVTPQSANVQISWGTDDNAGALSITSAGSWSIITYDPNRLLDPANTESEVAGYLVPGGLVRLVFRREGYPDEQVRLGFIDEIEFDLASSQGIIRATDAISLLVKAKLPEGLEHDVTAPTTLRARAAWVLQKAQVEYVQIEGPSNHLVNGSFEDGRTGWNNGEVVPWNAAPEGRHVLQLKGGGGYPKSLQGIPAFPGFRYVISGWAATQSGNKFATIGIQARDAGGGAVAGGPYMQATQANGKWEYLYGEYVVPEDGSVATIQADLRINLNATDATDIVMFDDIRLRPYNASEYDPVVGPPLDNVASAWQHITVAAYDALHAVWLDRNGVLRFRYFGNPRPVDVRFGAGIGGMEIESIEPKLSMENVYNHFTAQTDRIFTGPSQHVSVKRQDSIDAYGDLLLAREHRNPDALQWAKQLERDRSSAATQYGIKTIRPQLPEHLMQLLDLGMVDEIRLYADKYGPVLDKRLNVLGGRFEANTDTGWSAGIVTYAPANSWHPYVRTAQQRRVTNKGREIWTNFEGDVGGKSDSAQQEVRVSKLGSPDAVSGDETHAILMGFPDVDWGGGLTGIKEVMLQMYRPYHTDDMDEGYNWIYVQRIIEPWDENAVWPGPATTPEGENYFTAETFSPIWFEVQVTNIVKAWAPPAIGGQNAPNYGIKIFPMYQNVNRPRHILISTKLSGDQPYLMLTLTKEPL